MIKNTSIPAKIITSISKLAPGMIWLVLMQDKTQKIKKTLKILLPVIFPATISYFPQTEANIFTISSGDDVPKDTIVRPITISGIISFFTRALDPSTGRPAPYIRGIKPESKTKWINIDFSFKKNHISIIQDI